MKTKYEDTRLWGPGAGITWGEVDSGDNSITNPCPNCDSTARRIGPGSGPHFKRIECAFCGRWLRWLPKPGGAA
jgi:hypothetical protein